MINKIILTKNRKDGFTLLGTLIAAFIAVVVITALMMMISQVYRSGRTSKNQFIATNLTKEGIELVRNMRDNNWLHYPEAGQDFATEILWRGEATDTLCPGGTSCANLRSICDGDFTIDAKDLDLRLKTVSGTSTKLYLDGNNVYTHASTSATETIFSRSINISTVSAGTNEERSGCGTSVIADPTSASYNKPTPFIVTSTVTWTEPGAGSKSVVLKETFYDWLRQRP
jgi:Tfp pilus assembly protein PilV